MSGRELLSLAAGSLLSYRLRSSLNVLGIVIGIAAVILLTSIGQGAREYIVRQFTQFGTNLIAVQPGKLRTTGVPGAFTGTVRKLTLDDLDALRRLPGVEGVVPLALGTARVEAGERGRNVMVYGVSSEVPRVWKFGVRHGRFLPPGDLRRAAPVAVLGTRLKRELFGEASALGEHVRIGGQRFLAIGVMEPKGRFLNFDLDDTVFIPVAAAQRLFNRDDLVEIDVLFSDAWEADRVVEAIRRTMTERHGGEEDFTIITQKEMLDVLGRIFDIVSMSVGGMGGISLLVGAIGILTMMWISVNERTAEIGLAKAIGARPADILALFLVEAALLSVAGGAVGIVAGIGLARLLAWLLPGLPMETPASFVLAALGVSLLVGLASGALPARRAASLDPIDALRAE